MRNMRGKKGHALTAWVVTFGLVVSAIYIIRGPLKRVLERKIMATADYCFWGSWGEPASQLKGDKSSAVRSDSQLIQKTGIYETKDGKISALADTQNVEDLRYSNVEEGSEPLLKAFDLR